MKHLVLAALMAGGALPDGPVQAAPTAVIYHGGCRMAASTDPVGVIANPHYYLGLMHGAVVAVSDNAAEDLPVSVECVVKVNGAEQDSEPSAAGPAGPGFGTAFVAGEVWFEARSGDVVRLCEHVVAGATDFGEVCSDADHFDACQTLRFLGPADVADAGVVEIRPQGDVFVAGAQLTSCS